VEDENLYIVLLISSRKNNIREFYMILLDIDLVQPIPVAARSKVWLRGGSLAEIAGPNPAGGMNVFSYKCCVL